MNTKTKVVIVQPYVPAYRVAFFETLQQRLASEGIECVVAAGIPDGDQKERGDAVCKEWVYPTEQKKLNFHGRSFGLRITPEPWEHANAVILGLEGTSLPVYQALLASRRKRLRVGLWGHVRPYVSQGNRADLWLEKKQMKLADRIFAYTPGGQQYAIDNGIHPKKITTVMNTVDTGNLRSAIEYVSRLQIERFAHDIGFEPERSLCFIGGLDKSKRIQFLATALDFLWDIDRDVKILVGGRGPDRHLLDRAVERKQVVNLGYLPTHNKALVLKSTRGICMPGRIGLVAVDAIVANKPILTTEWEYHAPEAEYLTEGASRITSRNNARDYAENLADFINGRQPNDQNLFGEAPSIDNMVNNFSGGILQMLE